MKYKILALVPVFGLMAACNKNQPQEKTFYGHPNVITDVIENDKFLAKDVNTNEERLIYWMSYQQKGYKVTDIKYFHIGDTVYLSAPNYASRLVFTLQRGINTRVPGIDIEYNRDSVTLRQGRETIEQIKQYIDSVRQTKVDTLAQNADTVNHR